MAGLPGRHQVLAAILDPLHRRGHLACGEHDAHVLAHRNDLLAEPAAGVAHDDAHALGGDAEQAGGEGAQFVWGLRGSPNGEFGGGGRPFDDDAPGLHRNRYVHLLVDAFLHDMCCRGEQLLVGRHPAHTAGDIVGVGLVHDDL